MIAFLGCGRTDGFAPNASTTPVTSPTIVFAPTQISNLHTWYDGSDSSLMTLNGVQVSSWADKNNHALTLTQVTSSAQPIYQSNAINGKGAIRFDGNDVMSGNINSSVSSDVTVSYVVQLTTFNNTIPFSFNSTIYNYGPDVYFNSNMIYWNIGDNTTNPFSNSSFPTVNFPHIITVKNNSILNKTDLYLDGVYVGVAIYRNTSITNFIAPRIFIGNWVTGLYFMNGYFAELVIYNKVIDETERVNLEYYLKTKWGTP